MVGVGFGFVSEGVVPNTCCCTPVSKRYGHMGIFFKIGVPLGGSLLSGCRTIVGT